MSPISLGMEMVAPKIFVNPDMSFEDREKAARIVVEAQERIMDFYGGTISTPDILICSTYECFSGLGGTCQRGLQIGKSKILLSPKGFATPILAHELSHAELRARMDAPLDGILGIPSVPTWFDEGLAVAVSDEPAHSEKIWEEIVAAKMAVPKIESLNSLKEWNKAAQQFGDVDYSMGVPGKLCVVYATAGHEVRKWYLRVGREGLLKLIDEVKSGEDFERAFKSGCGFRGHETAQETRRKHARP
ncbi:hypothetical protein [Desulfolutivibrio sp.]|uniref:hypothetical protein n=1 Tax=Desulfolutivibrio sp. TaxID=2773296 RepID=UPI002F96CBB0